MDYSEILKSLRKESHTLRGRFQSIIHDAAYVAQFGDLPLIANERCGPWYVPPQNTTDSVYFKSTDGHTGEWKFSLRRLNLHLLPHFRDAPALVLVDSTRKGKLMPDALSKTVPIWCAVLNSIMFDGEDTGQWAALAQDNWLVTPPEMVSRSEHSSIARRIPDHVAEVKKLGLVTKEQLLQSLRVRKPIVPQWMYPEKASQQITSTPAFDLCCLTASVKSAAGRAPGWNFPLPYVQGAADDHELWASKEVCGGQLDHELFWNDIYYEPSEELRVIDMATGDVMHWLSEAEFTLRLNGIYDRKTHSATEPAEAAPETDLTSLAATGLVIGAIRSNVPFEAIAKNSDTATVTVLSGNHSISAAPKGVSVQHFRIDSSKKGSKKLRESLPEIMRHIGPVSPERKALIVCDTGKDLCVGVALCVLCRQFDTEWRPGPVHVNKDVVKKHLGHISARRNVNPSRNTLQSANSHLMGR